MRSGCVVADDTVIDFGQRRIHVSSCVDLTPSDRYARHGGFEGRSIARCDDRRAPLSPELWHCTAYPEDSGSHLGSTLKPGGAVLTLGVSRRSRSVAYVRADASPSEVHITPVWGHGDSGRRNPSANGR